MAIAPSMIQCVIEACPHCGETIRDVVVTDVGQAHGPVTKMLREAYNAHVVVVVRAAKVVDGVKQPRQLLIRCPEEPRGRPLQLDGEGVSLGEKECAVYYAKAKATKSGATGDGPVGKAVAPGGPNARSK